jgi:hypothetical protein
MAPLLLFMAQYRRRFAPEVRTEPVEPAFDADRRNSTANRHFTCFLASPGIFF